ncbi:MAG: hypothetical protein ABFS24_16480 [Pseudomonadota bacterium]
MRDLLGHDPVVVTERYARLSPDNVRAAVAQLDKPMPRFGHAAKGGLEPNHSDHWLKQPHIPWPGSL